MILEFIAGLLVSSLSILFFLRIKFMGSIENWIIVTSRFVYFAGHPLMDDEAKYGEITGLFGKLARSFLLVLAEILALLVFLILLIAASSVMLALLNGENIIVHESRHLKALFPDYLYQWPFLVGSMVPVLAVPFIPIKRESKENPYSVMDQMLHYVFMGNSSVAKALFYLERRLYRKKLKKPVTKNMYISGLARAGTTVLTQYFGQLDQFKSLSYINLPFLFLPRSWPRLISKKKRQARERAHKDGMTHSLDSNEALEEPFWRNYMGSDYIKDDHLVSASVSEKIRNKYAAFRKLVAGDKIYLSKNNNHLIRAGELHDLDEQAGCTSITIIPFREPHSQARSLLNQHHNLSELQSQDEFAHDYMDFLVHHEFGLSHKVAIFEDDPDKVKLSGDKDTLEYWLEVWYLFYSRVLDLYEGKSGFEFFCYEDFCEDPKGSLQRILELIDIPETVLKRLEIKKYNRRESDRIDSNSKYFHLYQRLRKISLNTVYLPVARNTG